MAPDPAHVDEAVARIKAGQNGNVVVEALVVRGMAREAASQMVAQLFELKLAAEQEAQDVRLQRELQGALRDAVVADHSNKAVLAVVFGVLLVAGGAVGVLLGGYALREASWLEGECAHAGVMDPMDRCRQYSIALSFARSLLGSGAFCLLLGFLFFLVARARGRAARAHR